MQFKEVVGHKNIKEKLIQTVNGNRISHAQLFLGENGSGILALAIAYAQYVSCENKQEDDSCGVCSSCLKFQKLVHPDLHFVFPVVKGKDDEIDNLFEEIITEHKKIKQLINHLKSDENVENTLDEFGHILESHIRKEERILFGKIQEVLTEDELTALENQLTGSRQFKT